MHNFIKSMGGATAMAFALALGLPGQAQTPLEAAAAQGQRLTAEEISSMIVDHTVTARSGERTFLFYYGADNTLTGRMVDGAWSDTGYFGITDNDQVCLSMTPDEGRLRCMVLIARDGLVQKFDSNGQLTFELLSFEAGNKL